MRGLVSALPLGANRPPLGQAGSPSLGFLNRQRGCWDLSPQDQHDAQLQACGRWHSEMGAGTFQFGRCMSGNNVS